MSSVRNQDALVMMFPRNPAAQDAVNNLGNLTKGRMAMEKGMAALGALQIQAFWSRRMLTTASPAVCAPTRAVPTASAPYRSNIRARSIMPAGPQFRLVA